MTRKLEDLKALHSALISMGFKYELPKTILDKEIAEKFGTSAFVMKSIIDELIKFKLIFQTDNPNIYKLVKGEKPVTKELTQEEIDSVDNILK